MIPIPPIAYIVAGLGLAAILAGTHWAAYSNGAESGAEAVQQKWDQQTAQAQAERAEAEGKARQRERGLQHLADQQRRKHREEVDRILSDHAALVDSLSHRPNRPVEPAPGAVPTPAGDRPAGCTGAELYQPDAAAFARLAADADRLRAGYRACKAAYEQAMRE